MYIDKAMEMACSVCNTNNIPYNKSVKWEVGKRSSKMLGVCSRKKTPEGYKYTIKINPVLFLEDNQKALIQTCIHELIHTCDDCFCHTGTWKRYAQKVTYNTEYKITRCYDGNITGMSELKAKDKYVIECVDCSFSRKYARAGKVVKHPSQYRCPLCHGRLQVKGL